MNGAESLIRSLVAAGVDHVFTNAETTPHPAWARASCRGSWQEPSVNTLRYHRSP